MKKFNLIPLVLLILISCQPESTETQKPAINLVEITIPELQQGYKDGKFTVAEVVQAYLDRINEIDKSGPALNSVITINPDAMEIAKSLDKEIQDGKMRGPMHGIPVILKDNIDTHDKMPTTAGSRVLANSHPLKDSWVTQKLRDAGAVILGKANLSEWANFHSSFSSSGWSGLGGQTKNPYDITRNPCGSSSGSGVAVSANLCAVAIGTETDGSIVCPSNNNGVVGIKPTVGLISRTGIIPISFTQDTSGPMARTVTDAAICLGALTGVDSTDSKTIDSEGHFYSDYTQFLNAGGLKGKRIGYYTGEYGKFERVDTIMDRAIDFLKSQGAEIIEFDKITQRRLGNRDYQLMLYEFKDGLNKYLATLGPDAPVKDLQEVIDATFKDSVEMHFFDHQILKQAQEKGDLETKEYKDIRDYLAKSMRDHGIDSLMNANNLDAIVAPTGSPAWKTDLINGDNFNGIFTSSPAAISGYPSITVPMGYIDGMPVGLSFIGKQWDESGLIEMAYAYEQGTKYRKAPEFKSSIYP